VPRAKAIPKSRVTATCPTLTGRVFFRRLRTPTRDRVNQRFERFGHIHACRGLVLRTRPVHSGCAPARAPWASALPQAYDVPSPHRAVASEQPVGDEEHRADLIRWLLADVTPNPAANCLREVARGKARHPFAEGCRAACPQHASRPRMRRRLPRKNSTCLTIAVAQICSRTMSCIL
jgi:hypothetical protein